jgi:hypothetical protein
MSPLLEELATGISSIAAVTAVSIVVYKLFNAVLSSLDINPLCSVVAA